MKNQLMTFSSEELNFSMSGILYEGKPAFDAVELAKQLGYANPADALAKHCKSLIKLNYSKSRELGFGEKPRGTQLAGQADLFRLILRSQLPSAERVQDWVCEDVLPSIMTTGSYSRQSAQETSTYPDMLSLAHVVAEATASATMKAVMETVNSAVVLPRQLEHSDREDVFGDTFKTTHAQKEQPNIEEPEYVPVHKVSWATGLSDPTCRRLVTFSDLPNCFIDGIRGLCVHREFFMAAVEVLIKESTPPAKGRKRWHHPEFGGFELRKDPKEIAGGNHCE
ncbi:TPA: Bro-N domain-containing protein [Klebsiella quasipneumoniae]|uniref:BRO-N domain-containing protein n=1 Tax=Klebsiella michiganensis TaxID=1134687 RepID=UPI001FD13525|nr:BRO family protein [Klebsiella michiganensis]MDK6960201.1 BRO family protein [Klebsiella michiganensis]MDS7889306.1 BRO family protein [Klebsiella michiganensis]MEC5786291.1 BRO family protein [Klebsiella michiganensis]UON99178.1 DNA-binding protein [Klebsiella michiganensis]HBM3232211.1 DNA-binding protein [Klebsiella michiganensis]